MSRARKALELAYGVPAEFYQDHKELSLLDFGKAAELKGIEVKANEANSTGQTGYGAEFITPTILENNLIAAIKERDSLASLINVGTMNGPVVDMPVANRGNKFEVFAEQPNVTGTAAPKTKAVTDKITFTAKKVGQSIYFTTEMVEDSVVNFRSYVEQVMTDGLERTIHDIILNGDTATSATTNINYIDGTPAGTEAYLLFNGARKLAIAAGGDRVVNAGTFDSTDLRNARKGLGLKGVYPEDLVWVLNSAMYYKLLNLSQVETMEKYGIDATIVNGRLIAIDGTKVVVNNELPALTDANGKVYIDTPASNTVHTAVLIHTPSYFLRFRRGLTMTPWTNFGYDQEVITATARIALAVEENVYGASAILRNITV